MKRGSLQFDYSGCQVLVTGGTQGIGHGIALAYRDAGAEVTITGTRAAPGDYDSDLEGLAYRQLDVSDTGAINTLVASLGALDVLVNNAGAAFPGGMDEWTQAGFEASLQVNLVSAFALARACRPLLRDSAQPGGASIVGIASLTSFFGTPIVPGYGAAKAGLVQLTQSLGMSWAEEGIRVNAVAAGLIETRLTQPVTENPAMADPVLARMPIKRWGQPADVAGAVLYLTSEAASFVTGETLVVDGGFCAVG